MMTVWIGVCSLCHISTFLITSCLPSYILFVVFLTQMVKLQACIKYCEEDYSAAKVTSSVTLSFTHAVCSISFSLSVQQLSVICSQSHIH